MFWGSTHVPLVPSESLGGGQGQAGAQAQEDSNFPSHAGPSCPQPGSGHPARGPCTHQRWRRLGWSRTERARTRQGHCSEKEELTSVPGRVPPPPASCSLGSQGDLVHLIWGLRSHTACVALGVPVQNHRRTGGPSAGTRRDSELRPADKERPLRVRPPSQALPDPSFTHLPTQMSTPALDPQATMSIAWGSPPAPSQPGGIGMWFS